MNLSILIGAGLKVPLQRKNMAWLARCPAGTRSLYWLYVLPVSAVITAAKRDGWWTKLDHLWLTSAPTAAIALLDIVAWRRRTSRR